MLELITPNTPAQIAEIRLLFEEYADGLGIDLCFQNFDIELRELPGDYREPYGILLLAKQDGLPAGCCALRPLAAATGHGRAAELKRLYVRPSFRGKGIAYRLVMQIVEKAKVLGYESVLLDTLETMRDAQNLYTRMGFQEIAPYYKNPIKGAKYLKLPLRDLRMPAK